MRAQGMRCRPLDQLEVPKRLELDRHVLQHLGRLINQEHLEDDVELRDGSDAFTVHVVRVTCSSILSWITP